MHILGIDYGRKKIGLAIADTDSKIAEPLKVIRFKNALGGLMAIFNLVKQENVERVVVGVSEGIMAEETKAYAKKLEQKLAIPVVLHDETLSTHEAQELSIKAGIKRKKRRGLEDAYASALILQSYLDSQTYPL